MANGQISVDKMFAFIATDPADNTEGVVSVNLGGQHFPLVGADMAMVDKLRRIAQQVADESGSRITVAEFTTRTDVDTITPTQ